MNKKFALVGDRHGYWPDFQYSIEKAKAKGASALIVLGDAGFNFYLNQRDDALKKKVDFPIYCVRGNHEERPEKIPEMAFKWDKDVMGYVYYQPQYPLIKYFMDGHCYIIDGYKCLVIGGAYSVDKYYRINNYMQNNGWCGWFEDEQLNALERARIASQYEGSSVDFVLTHTCPYSYEPRHLFLSGIDQEMVDDSMERWFDELFKSINIKYAWICGHFHEDLYLAPYIEMLMHHVETLDESAACWTAYRKAETAGKQVPVSNFDWHMAFSPCYPFWEIMIGGSLI